MKRYTKLLASAVGATVLAAAATAPAQAQQSQSQQGYYAGVSVSTLNYEESGAGTAKPTAIGVKLGREINKNFAIEGRFGTGLSDDNIGGSGVEVSLDYYLGAYAKGILPLTPRIALYGLAGVTYGELSASAGGLRMSGSDSDFSYGFGADFGIGATTSINVEWARVFEGTGYKLDAISVGLNFNF